jgi:transcriptional regulator GlxA family with amidase domain
MYFFVAPIFCLNGTAEGYLIPSRQVAFGESKDLNTNSEERFMAKALLERWEQLAGTARYDAKELAKLCNLSVRQLERDFSRLLARSPQDLLNEQRIKAAQQRLLSSQPFIKVVALELGFKQVSHFCRQFKEQTEMTPTEFISRKRF